MFSKISAKSNISLTILSTSSLLLLSARKNLSTSAAYPHSEPSLNILKLLHSKFSRPELEFSNFHIRFPFLEIFYKFHKNFLKEY